MHRRRSPMIAVTTPLMLTRGNIPGPAASWLFWSVTVKLPQQFRFKTCGVAVPGFTLTVRDTSLNKDVAGNQKQADLNLAVLGSVPGKRGGCGAPAPSSPPPSEVFLSGENSKNSTDGPFYMPRASLGVVAFNVTLAGWLELAGDHPGDPINARSNSNQPPNQSEDWHFSLVLDPDFIQRNYVLANSGPLAGAVMPGQPEDELTWGLTGDLGTYSIPLTAGHPPDVGTFMMPGEGDMTVELNAWHTNNRGPAPPNYVPDPNAGPQNLTGDPMGPYPVNAWAFDVTKGSVFAPNTTAAAPPLQLGNPNSSDAFQRRPDYVIVTGTLWQDVAHLKSAPPNPLRECYNAVFSGQGGWLEIHPVTIFPNSCTSRWKPG